jgi:hypothetical protein
MTWEARNISISVARPPAAVAEFAGNPRNLPAWAGWGGRGVRESRGRWYLEGGGGWGEVVFTGPLWAGVLDHRVILDGGDPGGNLIPMRVVANGDGSEIIYTMFRDPALSDEEFEASVATTTANLETLRRVLES